MEIQHAPKKFFNGMCVPLTQSDFFEKFPGGLTCSCPSNTLFTRLQNWKNHIKTKRHELYINTTIEKNELTIDKDHIIKQQKIQIGKLSQENEQLKNRLLDYQKKNN